MKITDSTRKYNNHWKDQKERGSVLGIHTMLVIYKILGERMCKIILYPVLLYFYFSNTKVRKNLHYFYAQIQQQGGVVKSTPLANIINFGFGIIDRLSLWMDRFEIKRIRKHNSEILYKQIGSGKGAIIFSSHLGNFELSRAVGRLQLPIKMNVIVDIENAKKINQVMKAVNKNFLVDIIPITDIDISLSIRLKEKVDAGELIVIAADRVNSSNHESSVYIPFLGKKAAFPIGPYILAKILDCPVFSLYCFSSNDKKYDVFFELLFEKVDFNSQQRAIKIKEYATLYAKQLETYCLQYPQQWYNFYDFWR